MSHVTQLPTNAQAGCQLCILFCRGRLSVKFSANINQGRFQLGVVFGAERHFIVKNEKNDQALQLFNFDNTCRNVAPRGKLRGKRLIKGASKKDTFSNSNQLKRIVKFADATQMILNE